ncbi:ASCH domain-containing protein [Rhodococcus aerolatus]
MAATVDELRRLRPDLAGLAVAEMGSPGPLRARLVAAYLDGTKTAGSSLRREHEAEGVPLPVVGDREVMVDEDARPVAVLEVTRVEQARLADVGLEVALAEGEGFASAAQWRAEHERFWTSDEVRARLGRPTFVPDDDELVVVTWFAVVERLG